MKNIYYTCREICFGSARISILALFIINLIVYCLYFFLTNAAFIPLLMGKINEASLSSRKAYVEYLESANINTELTLLVPIISTIILLIPATNQLKSNIQIRILPISARTKTIAFMFIILACTLVSYFFIFIFENSIIHYARTKYIDQVIAIQESYGEFYKNRLSNGNILSPTYDPYSKVTRHLLSSIILSMVFNTIALTMNLLFNRYSIVKGVILLFIVLYTAFNIRTYFANNGSATVSINSFTYETVYYIYFPLLIICFLFTFYYLLKQKEN